MFKKKTLSSLPPEEAGTFSEFNKKTPTRKSLFSKGGQSAESQEITFQMSDAQREMLRHSGAPKQKTEEEKRTEQEKAWEEAEKAEEIRVAQEEQERRLTTEAAFQRRAQEEEERRASQHTNNILQPTSGDMFDRYEYQLKVENDVEMDELEEIYKSAETTESSFERIMELKKRNADKLSASSIDSGSFGNSAENAIVLGVGAFGRVLKARQKEGLASSESSSSSQSSIPLFVAIKEVNKKTMSSNEKRSLKNEIGILNQCCHNHLLLFYEFYETDNKYCLITELCEGGELFDFIRSKADQSQGDKRLNESQVSSLMFSLLDALSFLQDLNVAHRDIKPENILFKKRTPVDANDLRGIVLADFGFATVCQGASLSNPCGSTHFIAPEIHKGHNYDFRCDIWSCGVLCHLLLTGTHLFSGSNDNDIAKVVKACRGFAVDSAQPQKDKAGVLLPCLDMDCGMMEVCKEARELVSSCLKATPQKRPLANSLLTSSWFASYTRDVSDVSKLKAKKEMMKQASKPIDTIQEVTSDSTSSSSYKKSNVSDLFKSTDNAAAIAVNAAKVNAAAAKEVGDYLNDDEDDEAVEVVTELSALDANISASSSGSKLPRTCSDIGVGSGSLFHTPPPTSLKKSDSQNYTTMGGDVNEGLVTSGAGWWVGVLGPHSAFICPLTKKPFVDPVISVTDGVTYEREALVKRNLSRLVAERQRIVWQNARESALDELVNDSSFTMPQKLSRLVCLKTVGFFRNTTGTTTTSDELFDQAKARLLTSKCSSKAKRTESTVEVQSFASMKMKFALNEARLTDEEKLNFLGKHDGTGKGFEDEDDDEDDGVLGGSGAASPPSPPKQLNVNDEGYDMTKKAVRRVRRASVVKQDISAGMVANDGMRLAVLELKRLLVGGPVAEAHARAKREEENARLKQELAAVQASRQQKKQKEQAKAMHDQLKSMSLQDMIGGATGGRRLSMAARGYVSGVGGVHGSDNVSEDEMVTAVDVTLDKSDEERVIYRAVIKNKAGSSGSCAHRFAAYRDLYEKLGTLGGAAFYFGGHKQLETVQAAFPNKDFARRKMGINLSEEQLEERREGICKWLRLLLMPQSSHIEGGNTVLAAPIKSLVWECLKLDARVTHL